MSQISTKSQKRVDQLLVGLIVIGVGLVWFSIYDAKWILASIGILLAGISYYFFRTRIKNRVKTFSEKFMGQMEMVKDISSTGFKVFKLNEQTTALHQWKDIDEVVLKDETDLVFKFNNREEKVFGFTTIGYYKLLKNIPQEKLKDTDTKTYQQTTFENLTTCPTCGYIAYKKTKCLSCRTESFKTAIFVEEENEADYMRQEQLEYFCTDHKDEAVEFYPKKEKDDIFEFDKNWKPIVTESEVIKWGKENYWD